VTSTETTWAAREHARAQDGARVLTQPTIPARLATDLPAGVDADDVVWDEVLGAGGCASKRLARGTRVRLTDLEGDACVSVLCLNAELTSERLCIADTVKVQWNAYPRRGTLLLSDLGRVLATIVDDVSQRHDAFCGPSTRATNDARYGDGRVEGSAPNARDRFLVAVAKHGLSARDVHPCLTLFKGVRVALDGRISWDGAPTEPGRYVELRCELPLLLVFANTPHVLDERKAYTCTPLRITAWRAPRTTVDDEFRGASPEARRAFENTDDYLNAIGAA